MDKGIKFPKSYKNRNLGRIVDGIFNFDNGTGFLYEQEYNGVREALEKLRSDDTLLFQKAMSFVVLRSFQGAGENFSKLYEKHFDEKDRQSIAEKMKGAIGGLGSGVVQEVIWDWNKNSSGLKKEYEPAYMFNVGVPVQGGYLNSIAQRILKVRERDPNLAEDLDKLFNKGSAKNLSYPDQWFDKNVPEGDGLAKRNFRETVSSNFRPMDFAAIRELIKLNPYRTTPPVSEQEDVLEL